MAELHNVGRLGIRYTFKANEGTVTMEEVEGVGGLIEKPQFNAPLRVGDFVEISDDFTVRKADTAHTEKVVIGQVVTYPQYQGMEFTEGASWGNYTPRLVTVELMATAIRMVKLEDSNSEVNAGDYLEPDGVNEFDEAGTATNIVALEGANASSGDEIPALFGFTGYETGA